MALVVASREQFRLGHLAAALSRMFLAIMPPWAAPTQLSPATSAFYGMPKRRSTTNHDVLDNWRAS